MSASPVNDGVKHSDDTLSVCQRLYLPLQPMMARSLGTLYQWPVDGACGHYKLTASFTEPSGVKMTLNFVSLTVAKQTRYVNRLLTNGGIQ